MKKRTGLLLTALGALLLLLALLWLNREWLIAKVYIWTLETQGRVEALEVSRVVEMLNIQAGDVVADVGAGTGLFSLPMAKAAGADGLVYAVDINQDLLAHLDEVVKSAGVHNIRTVLGGEEDPRIPEPVDLIFICNTLHHISNRGDYLKTLSRYLRRGGRLAVIDFRDGDSPHLIPSMNFSQNDLLTWTKAAGYKMLEEHRFLEENFFLLYTCETCPATLK